MSTKPEPRIVSEICSLCGLDWKRHGKNPTAEKCITLLLDEVSSLHSQLAARAFFNPWATAYTQAINAAAHSPQFTSGTVLPLADTKAQ